MGREVEPQRARSAECRKNQMRACGYDCLKDYGKPKGIMKCSDRHEARRFLTGGPNAAGVSAIAPTPYTWMSTNLAAADLDAEAALRLANGPRRAPGAAPEAILDFYLGAAQCRAVWPALRWRGIAHFFFSRPENTAAFGATRPSMRPGEPAHE